MNLWVLLATSLALAAARDNGVSRTPPMGWNTWCTNGPCGPHPEDNCNDRELREVAKAMKQQGLLAAGWDRINLDDCWSSQDRDNATGRLVPVKDRFPDGLAPLIAYLHSEGFKFGLYIDGGLHTCRGQVGSFGYYETDAKAFAEWGVDYVKMDWCDSKNESVREETGKWAAALNATGRAMHYQCPCLINTMDECNGTVPPAWLRENCNSWRFYSDHHDKWASTSSVMRALKIRAASNVPFAWNDPDFLMTGGQGCADRVPGEFCPGQTPDEYRAEFSIWCITASPLLVATDIRNLTQLQREALLNTELIAVNQDPDAGPARNTEGGIWFRRLGDGDIAVVLHNDESTPQHLSVNFTSVGAGAHAAVRDLWAHEAKGVHSGVYSVLVAAYGAAAFRLTPQQATQPEMQSTVI